MDKKKKRKSLSGKIMLRIFLVFLGFAVVSGVLIAAFLYRTLLEKAYRTTCDAAYCTMHCRRL